jgi:hypothetical protein
MRALFCAFVLVLVASVGAAFYFGLCTISTEHVEKNYVVSLVIHPDFMVPSIRDEADKASGDEQSLVAKGRVVSVDPSKQELVITENIKNVTFQVDKAATVLINGQAATLADLRGGDDASVEYTRRGQQLLASLVRCTRKATNE